MGEREGAYFIGNVISVMNLTKKKKKPPSLISIIIKSRLSLIVRVNVALNMTAVVNSDRRFDNLCGSK